MDQAVHHLLRRDNNPSRSLFCAFQDKSRSNRRRSSFRLHSVIDETVIHVEIGARVSSDTSRLIPLAVSCSNSVTGCLK
jgi:hypothetical protein